MSESEIRTPRSALIVGAGIVGACIGYRLAKAGIAVTIADRTGPHAGASGRSWAWLNAVAAADRAYFELRKAGLGAWHDLEQDLAGRLRIDWSGALLWDPDLFDTVNDAGPRHADWGYGVSTVDADVAAHIEPLLAAPPTKALFSKEDGLIDGAEATRAVLDAAVEAGADLVFGAVAEGLIRDGARIGGLVTDTGPLHADVTVIAAGTGTPALLGEAGFDLPMAPRKGLLVTTHPVEARMKTALWTDTVHIKQLADGALVIGENAHADGALDDPSALAADMVARVEALMPSLAPLRIAKRTVAARPIPGDGFPVIGPVPGSQGLYVATMHSGMTLGAVTGVLLADEIVHGRISPLLAPYRPERFLTGDGS